MKVLLCERDFAGHRKKYCETLLSIDGIEFYLFAPENVGVQDNHFTLYRRSNSFKSFTEYFKWISTIKKIVSSNNIDIVHILDGDSIMRFFGFGFSLLHKAKLLITYHHFFEGKIRNLSYRRMMHGNREAIVHTDVVRDDLLKINIKNVEKCTYPVFDEEKLTKIDTSSAKKYWGIDAVNPTIGIIGGMEAYKNIPPFLSCIKDIQDIDFQVLICGTPSEISTDEMEKAIAPLGNKVKMDLRRVSDDEYLKAIKAADIIFSIYNRNFDGASGPLTDGVCAGKMILSCNHGSLGQIVEKYHLGYTADCDNTEDMRLATMKALNNSTEWAYDSCATAYKNSLTVSNFKNRYKNIYYQSIQN